MGQVLAVLRYPLKSARGENLQVVAIGEHGLHGDRSWACIDATDATVGSVKHPGRWGRLLDVTATLADGHRADVVTVEVGGEHLPAGSERADAALGAYLGRAVHLSHEVPATARLHRLLPSEPGLVPEWATGLPGQELTTRIDGAQPGGRFVDFGAVHLVTSGELTALARRLGRPCVPASRFRPNLVLDAPADPEPGQELSIGDVVMRVLVPTPRCVVPGLVGGSHAPDRALLRSLAGHYRRAVADLGRAACFGTYAEVLAPGHLRVGDDVRWERPGQGGLAAS